MSTEREAVRDMREVLDEYVLASMRRNARQEYGTHQHHAKRVLDAACEARAALGKLESEIEVREQVIAETMRGVPLTPPQVTASV